MTDRPTRRSAVAVLAAAALATGALASPAAADVADDDPQLVVVPLDDRPANVYFPTMTAATADVDVVLPPEELVGTFTTPGDGDSVGQWLLEQDDADGYVVSVSMLAYGGLIASRTGVAATAEEARERVSVLQELREQNPGTPIYVYDTIQRLALSALGENAELYYTLIQQWAILTDRVENLGEEELRDDLEAIRAQIPDDVLADYVAARERNHEVNRMLVEWAADGVVDHLVLAQDDAAPHGLHRAEREQLRALVEELGVQDTVQIFPGADEVDATLVSRFVQQLNGTSPAVAVEYSGIDGSEWVAPFEDTTYAENVERHVVAAGGTVVAQDPDIWLMVNTPSDDDGDRAADLDAFVARVAELEEAGEDVIVLDALEVNRAERALTDRLEESVEVASLLAYSAWNTAGNALGIATGHGFARWSYLEAGSAGDPVEELVEQAEAHISYLLHRFVLDDRWKNDVQIAAYAEAQGRGWNVFGLTEEQTEVMEAFVVERLVPLTEDFHAEHFAGQEVELARGTAPATVGELSSTHVALPWPRLFETELEPHVQVVAPEPEPEPTEEPTVAPTEEPTVAPTEEPTAAPTTPSPAEPGAGGGAATAPAAPASSPSGPDRLPATGAATLGAAGLVGALLLGGAALLVARRRTAP
ncbi:DUF4127 family protein [Oceanitalea stevensii]|uniref:DUF4127 family protein n=1 Tax=Oceanitalea stevensii TaxID=2763072 RepID=A0ABR8Z4R5_9MICO|nr:DUF4127 family protein [Oceanitalea stevensii]MBD8063340.1 DUF4127 family protein [Oceanitalea stevensii]